VKAAADTRYAAVDAAIEAMLAAVGRHVVIGIPLGTGKPNAFVNALYRRALSDPGLRLEIFTALTPTIPEGRSLLERRFLGPLVDRLYRDYEPLEYATAMRAGRLPPNVTVTEFYFSPGAWLHSDYAQQHYVSENYSHVTRALIARGVNVVAQAIAAREVGGERRYSFGSNPDLILDLVRELPEGRRPFVVGQVSEAMPYMTNDAEVSAGFFDAIIEAQSVAAPLFAVPNKPVGLVDYAIATHVASLIADGGTLQIGIGSHGDAIAHILRLRQQDNATYRQLVERLVGPGQRRLRSSLGIETAPFVDGLYGSSEMLVEGLLHLIDAGVLKRGVASVGDPARSVVLHGGFFIGSPEFYRRLHALNDDERDAIEMTGIRFVNTLDDDFAGKVQRRAGARFVNSAMMVTLDGSVVSDARADKRVVSGVGGQHDFVAMAQRLPGARSVIVVPSIRVRGGRAQSNIVFDYAHVTVPRQFRDIVVTEYGAADLRAVSDRDVFVRLIGIADSRFQPELLRRAQAAGKVEPGYRIPDALRNNFPARIEAQLADVRAQLPHFPLTSDFTDAEGRIAVALDWLKTQKDSRLRLCKLVLGAPGARDEDRDALARLDLARARGVEEHIARRLLLAALEATRSARPLVRIQPSQPIQNEK